LERETEEMGRGFGKGKKRGKKRVLRNDEMRWFDFLRRTIGI
jgi:hypothetical protein